MDNEQPIVELIEKLDKLAPKEGAIVKFQQYGGGPDESRIIANRNGYLRFGIELLKASFAEPVNKAGDNPNAININLDFVPKDSEIQFDWFDRTEDLNIKEETSSSWISLFLGIIFVIFIALSIIGLITAIKWIF